MIEGVIVKSLVVNCDARGSLTELFRSDGIPAGLFPVMAYISVTKPGIGRGPHEHREQTDTFAFVGPGRFRISLWDARTGSPTRGAQMVIEAGVGHPTLVIVPPGVVHGYKNVSDEDGMVLNFPDRLYAGPGKKGPVDEIRHEDGPSGLYPMG